MRSIPRTVLMVCFLAGCQTDAMRCGQYETAAKDPHRDTQAANVHSAKAVALLKVNDLEQAEKELKAALAADLFHGAAHNNLGTVYFRQKKLYLAAWEFQYAAKLMPTKAEPRNNLGLVFEAVGKLDDAVKSYEEATQLEPGCIDVIANLARAYVRLNRNDDKTRQLLTDVVLKDHRPEWVSWARERLALMGKPGPAATQPGPK
jgi:Flp pilus assembly protein TadD